ncbi:PH domain-containing protein [Phthorimaea operculella]|nr:PH domain-containing protein [Phthorimaea operculella]
MKINDKNLCAFASSATPVDREGWLDLRCEVGRSYQAKWFMLKGNLLFYFDKQGDKEPVGVIILEGCTIELTEEESYSFKIVFHCEGGRTYYLCTDSQASMESWMKACASDAAEEAAMALVTVTPCDDGPKVPPRGQRYNPFNKVAEEGSTGPSARHHKENVRPEVARKKRTFRDIHALFGRKILLDRVEWRARISQHHQPEKPLIQL